MSKRKPTKRAKGTNQTTVVPQAVRVVPGEDPPPSGEFRYLRVGDWWVPIALVEPVRYVGKDGKERTLGNIKRDKHRVPIGSTIVSQDIWNAFRNEGRHVYEGWRRRFDSWTTAGEWGVREDDARDLAVSAVETGFYLALLRYADDLKSSAEAKPILERLREHHELLAAEGRAAKAANDRRRADLICRLYKAVRPSFPEGRKGNGSAHRVVAERYKTRTGESVSERTIRDTVNKAGLSASRRRERKD